MQPRISFITLGVSDLSRARHFYTETLGLVPLASPPTVVFFEMGATWLALFPRSELAADAGICDDAPAAASTPSAATAPSAVATPGFPGFALAHNVRSPTEVDQLLEHVATRGGRLVKPGQPTDWGGYAGYFADPDGFLWEVAWNPKFPHV